MIETIQDARSALEAEGLHVSVNNLSSLLIGGSITDAGEGLTIYKDACAINCRAGQWVASFPADGLLSFEFPGSLPELVSLVVAVYDYHRQHEGELKEAFKRLIKDAEQFLIGRSLAGV